MRLNFDEYLARYRAGEAARKQRAEERPKWCRQCPQRSYSLGLCKLCYQREWRAANPDRKYSRPAPSTRTRAWTDKLPGCRCGVCHTCQVREDRHAELGGVMGCSLCAGRHLKQRDFARSVDRALYSQFPFPMRGMYDVLRERGLLG
ncbi:MAG: hypothetical protein NVS1B14_03740 [Vulcanimicrobiaceae bacterium]